jgi:hypothetical protein
LDEARPWTNGHVSRNPQASQSALIEFSRWLGTQPEWWEAFVRAGRHGINAGVMARGAVARGGVARGAVARGRDGGADLWVGVRVREWKIGGALWKTAGMMPT